MDVEPRFASAQEILSKMIDLQYLDRKEAERQNRN